jgi:hypothetical protein
LKQVNVIVGTLIFQRQLQFEEAVSMRISGFILGGICGMMAASYLSKKRGGVISWASSAAGNMMSGAKDKMVGSALNRKFGRAGNDSGTDQAAGSNKSWETIENLINSDPQLKQQTSELLSNSAKNTSH